MKPYLGHAGHALALLAAARDAGAALNAAPGGRLSVSPAGVLPEDLRAALLEHKAEVLAELWAETERSRVNAAVEDMAASGHQYDRETFETSNQDILAARATRDLEALDRACASYLNQGATHG